MTVTLPPVPPGYEEVTQRESRIREHDLVCQPGNVTWWVAKALHAGSPIMDGYRVARRVEKQSITELQQKLAATEAELKLWKPLTLEEAEAALAEAESIPVSDDEIDRIVERVADPAYRPTEPEHVLLVAKIRQLEKVNKQQQLGWIPMPPAPGGRLPTERDANILGYVTVTRRDTGRVDRLQVGFGGFADYASAWMPDPLPAPCVPSEPEKPKRREWWNVWIGGVFFAEYGSLIDAEHMIEKHPNGYDGEIEHCRTVLSGDIDPDAAKALVDYLEEESNWLRKTAKDYGTIRLLLDACRKAGE